MSATKLAELESDMAERILEQQACEGAFISSTFSKTSGMFVSFAWDNNDINEETLTGEGTTHCTNGIIVQHQVQSCALPPQLAQTIPSKQKGHRRRATISPPFVCEDFLASGCVGPQPLPVDVNCLTAPTACLQRYEQFA